MSEVPAPGEAALAAAGAELVRAAGAGVPPWVERSVGRRYRAWSGAAPPGSLVDESREAGRRAGDEVVERLGALVATDVDQQRTNPLTVLRSAVRHPTAVLARWRVPPAERDEFARRLFPDDDYDLSPAGFADVDAALADAGLVWGAAKAYVVLQRRRAEGKR